MQGPCVHPLIPTALLRILRSKDLADGSEKFYSHDQDPHEWKNLAADRQSPRSPTGCEVIAVRAAPANARLFHLGYKTSVAMPFET
jgi:hypothetical protein